jgi:hypothetical protein
LDGRAPWRFSPSTASGTRSRTPSDVDAPRPPAPVTPPRCQSSSTSIDVQIRQ